jgi:hypothetical protein
MVTSAATKHVPAGNFQDTVEDPDYMLLGEPFASSSWWHPPAVADSTKAPAHYWKYQAEFLTGCFHCRPHFLLTAAVLLGPFLPSGWIEE